MYINPFTAGILATLFVEAIAFIAVVFATAYKNGKEKKKNGRETNSQH